MQLFRKDLPNCVIKVYAKATPDEVNRAYEDALLDLQKDVEYKGFRKGKVPLEIIETNFSNQVFKKVISNLLGIVFDETYSELDGEIDDIEDFKPLSELKKGMGFSFYVKFRRRWRPTNEINFDNLTIEYEEYFFDEKMVKEYISEILKEFEESNEKISEKDKVTLRLINGTNENATFDVIASDLPSLIGKKRGDEVEFTLFELENYVAKIIDSINKDNLTFKIDSVKKPKKKEITDETVASKTSFKTLEEYKNWVTDSFSKEVEFLNNMSKRNSLRDFIAKNTEIDFKKEIFVDFILNRFSDYFNDSLSDEHRKISEVIFDKEWREDFYEAFDYYYREFIVELALLYLGRKFYIKPDEKYELIALNQLALRKNVPLSELEQNLTQKDREQIRLSAFINTTLDYLASKVNFKPKNRIPYPKL